uniref:Cytochrome P450 n=1 Tax=Kalanchoe fedtschenkoi TaxID=63787 RepID=A0A7N0VE38_KALFE
MASIALYMPAAILACLILRWSFKAINWLWLKPRRLETCLRQQGFKGNSYRFLYGDTKDNLKMIQEASSKPIHLSDDIVGSIPISVYAVGLSKPPLNPLAALLAKGLASYEGDKWAKHRKLINPAFHSEKLKVSDNMLLRYLFQRYEELDGTNMMPAFHHSTNEMVCKWEKLALASANRSCELDVWQDLQTMTRDAISRTAFGSSYEEGKRIFELQRELTGLVVQASLSVYVPGWRFETTKMNQRMKALYREIKASLRVIIKKKEEALEKGKNAPSDLLGMLLESNLNATEEHKNKRDFGMSLDEVIEECKLFYFAGQETTSAMLQKRARDEVLQVFGNENPNLDGLNHLKTVTMILQEALRLYPPATVVNRTTHKEEVLGNLTLPAGVLVTVPILSIQRDPQLWGEDAHEFKPDRFSEGVSNATKGQVRFIPFIWGPRICIGQNFALLEGKMAMPLVLQRFSFELSPSYTHAPYSRISLQPQHGANLILHKL